MTQRPRRPTQPALSPVELVRQRVLALTRLSLQLVNARSERELAMSLVDALRSQLSARQVGLYVRSPSTGHLVPAPGTPGDALLRMVCAVAPGLPEPLRHAPGGPGLLDHLQTAFHAQEDGVRGPLMAAPLADPLGGGLVALEGEPRIGDFGPEDMVTFTGIAAQVTLALMRLRNERATGDRAVSPHDLQQASAVQRRILPALPATLSGFQIAVEYSPAYHVGGDFYDLVPVGDGAVIALMGDVAGKGVSAALLMSRVHSTFRHHAGAGRSPGELLSMLNDELCKLLPDDSFATAACLRLDANRRTMVVANAGHVLPVVRRRGGAVVSLGRQAGAALGMLAGETYYEQEAPLDPGDIVVLMTDGVVEAVERDPRNMWKLIDLVAQAPHEVGAISQQILAAVEDALGARRVDDVTLMALMPVIPPDDPRV